MHPFGQGGVALRPCDSRNPLSCEGRLCLGPGWGAVPVGGVASRIPPYEEVLFMPNVVLDVAVALRLWTDAVRCARVRRTGRGEAACMLRAISVCIADMGDLSHHYHFASRRSSHVARRLYTYTYCLGGFLLLRLNPGPRFRLCALTPGRRPFHLAKLLYLFNLEI